MDAPGNNWEEMGLTGALATNYARDSKAFLELLATTLASVLPDQVKIDRKHGLFVKEHPVVKIELYFGDETYGLDHPDRGPMIFWRRKTVHGISLKTDEMSVNEWLAALGTELNALQGVSERAFFALKEFLQ
jgi:hypothetical protein